MKIAKKLAGLVLTVSIVLGTSVTAFAAPNDDVLKALKDAKVPQTYLIQAENYLKTTTLTAEQAAGVKEQVTKVDAIVKAAGTTDLSKLSDAQKQQVIAAITDAGKDINLTVSLNKDASGAVVIAAKDATGKEVVNLSSKEVKQTGVNNTILALGAFMVIAAAGSVFVVRKVGASNAA